MKAKLSQLALVCAVVGGGFLVTACGGGGSSVVPVGSANTVAAINPTTGAAVVGGVLNNAFTFANGVAGLGMTGSTKLTLTGTGAAPSFSATSAAGTTSGTLSYGSCIFKITAAPDASLVGTTFTEPNCSLTLPTKGVPANGSTQSGNATFTIGSYTGSAPVTYSLNSAGAITINGFTLAVTAPVSTTGAGS